MILIPGLFLFSCDKIPFISPPKDMSISEGVDVELIDESYATLTISRCVNVDIINCSIKNLVLEECMNVDVTGCAFNGSGTAVTTKRCALVSITDCRFSPRYDQRLSETMSLNVEIE
ncbi:MAG: hypothetical protein JW885_11805 [Deltaproteobacteria bacterium]|nr:hypothetical protein [Candidatus Zymogenaceae bacterium]